MNGRQQSFKLLTLCVCFFLGLLGASAAQPSPKDDDKDCLLRVDGTIYDIRPCEDMSSDDIAFGSLNAEGLVEYWVKITRSEDGRTEAFWNESYGQVSAQSSLGEVKLVDRYAGQCFENIRVLLCRNIPKGQPIYYIEFNTASGDKNSLLAYVEGLEYVITHPAWGDLKPYGFQEMTNLDEDPGMETLIFVGSGGNCCPADISVISYRGGGFFTFLDSSPLSGGWGGAKLIQDASSKIIRVYDIAVYDDGDTTGRQERDYAIINGKPQIIAERVENSAPTAIASIGVEEIKLSRGKTKSLLFDIDGDSAIDQIDCAYWERWEAMNCKAMLSGADEQIYMQCKRIAISPVVFGENKGHRLMCDQELVEY